MSGEIKWPKKPSRSDHWSDDLPEYKDMERFKHYFVGEFPPLKDGEPCESRGCLNHRTHPCSVCGRVNANSKLTREYYYGK